MPGLLLTLVTTLLLVPALCAARDVPSAGGIPSNPSLVEAWLDGFFEARIRALHVPGAAIVIVKDGGILVSKGYGFASLAERRPVDPEKTVFRVASVSKPFTATAVMQLAEQGKVDLHADVNRYLKKFRVEATYERPVTLAHLLTHTAGFDERFIGMATRSKDAALPLGEYLGRRMPPRILPPGEFIAYSNHGMALAGHVVEEVSGVPFARFAQEGILRPLGMSRSSFEPEPSLLPDMAVGYEHGKDGFRPVPFDCIGQLAPAGGLNATAADVARFMLAQLQLGRYGGTRILGKATAREMQRQQFSQHPRLPGFAYGFYEHFENGQRALAHSGSWRGFASLLVLIPERGTGFFVVLNRQQPGLALEFASAFFDRYFPVQAAPDDVQPRAGFVPQAERFRGSYRSTRHARRTMEKLAIMVEEYRVTTGEDGSLTVRYPGGFEQPTRWVRVDRLLFEHQNGEEFLAFREDADGRITHMFLQAFDAPAALEKLGWYETTRFQLGLASFIFFFFLSACAGWPTSWFVHWRQRGSVQSPSLARRARLLAGCTSGLGVAFFVAVELGFQNLSWLRLEYGMPRWLAAMFVIPILLIPLTAGLIVFCILAWRDAYWSLRMRLQYTLVTLSAILYIPFLHYWNLLGFRF